MSIRNTTLFSLASISARLHSIQIWVIEWIGHPIRVLWIEMIWTSYNGRFVWRRWLQMSKSHDTIVLTLTETIQLSGFKFQGLTQPRGRLLAWLRQIGHAASIIHSWSTRGNVPREAHARLQKFCSQLKTTLPQDYHIVPNAQNNFVWTRSGASCKGFRQRILGLNDSTRSDILVYSTSWRLPLSDVT